MAEPATIYVTDTLTTRICGQCGIVFAAPNDFWAERHRDHKLNWYCPNGHARVFMGETEAAIARRERDEAKRDADWQRQLREKADKKIRKLERRITNGVCPCCKRHFENVERHMRDEHPDFAEKKEA